MFGGAVKASEMPEIVANRPAFAEPNRLSGLQWPNGTPERGAKIQ
jgi:hypothetical protein